MIEDQTKGGAATGPLDWREGGVPVSTRFGDPYFSLEDGAAESAFVYLGGNDLPARFQPGFHIAELGFGTGLNFLVALDAYRKAGVGGALRFTSFEAFPMAPADIACALAHHSHLPTDVLTEADWVNDGLSGPDFTLTLIIGDARQTVPRWQGQADAWFLDGFAPARNPELWGQDLMAAVARHTAPGGTFATYTAAGHVRSALAEAGFDVTRVPGFGRKRHMTTGRMT